jgi:hypothetical protein
VDPHRLECVLRLLTAYDTLYETADVKIVRPAGVVPDAAKLPAIYAAPDVPRPEAEDPEPGMESMDLSEDGEEDPRSHLARMRAANFKQAP